ncbi:MAG TPA: glycosyltransferase family 9 protein [Syntrophorhabdales bacterium]|nr:glycosyltransferase family 9 protein [Syntrophorhabdales bacterium]
MERTAGNEIFLIHLGGLGDVCLSESTFHSLFSHFGRNICAVGYKRFLGLFPEYFEQILSVEERSWLWLFSDLPSNKGWKQAILIGKDKSGEMRKRLSAVSSESPLFIDLYPEEKALHVEAYQLAQLQKLGIRPLKQEIEELSGSRIILYPERSYAKKKWPYEHFIALYKELKDIDIDVVLLEAYDSEPQLDDSRRFEDLEETARFFTGGGLFFSNDSGVAHLAAACGLATITLFWDHDPAIWHPRGRNIAIQCATHSPNVAEMASLILQVREQA